MENEENLKSLKIINNAINSIDSEKTTNSYILLRSDKVLLEIEGLISIKDSTSDELAIIIKTGKDEYKMHYVYTGSEIVYLVEQLENTNTDPYHWKIRVFAVIPEFDIGRSE